MSAEIKHIRQRQTTTDIIAVADDRELFVTIRLAPDKSTGRAIGFRWWIRGDDLTLTEQEAVDAALEAVQTITENVERRPISPHA